MSYNMVLEAFVASVKKDLPSVNFHRSQVSIVPNKSLSSFNSFFDDSILSSIHLILVAEKYASITSPVIFCIFFANPFLVKSLQ